MPEFTMPLNEVVGAFRRELKAVIHDSDEGFQLPVKELELELAVQVNDEAEVGAAGGLLSVFTASARAKASDTLTHRVRIVFDNTTLDKDGKAHQIKMSGEY